MRKIVIGILVVVLLLIGAFITHRRLTAEKNTLAEETVNRAYRSHDEQTVSSLLKEHASHLPQVQQLIVQAATETRKGEWHASDALLVQAREELKAPFVTKRSQAESEITLLAAINAAEEKDTLLLEELSSHLKELPISAFYPAFFRGVTYKLEKEFALAAACWESAGIKPKSHTIATITFTDVFPRARRSFELAEVLVESGDWQKARPLLETLEKARPSRIPIDKVRLLLARTYLLEASEEKKKTTSLLEQFYAIARTLPKGSPAYYEAEEAATRFIQEETQSCIQRQRPRDMRAYLQIVQKHLTSKARGVIGTSLVQQLLEEDALSHQKMAEHLIDAINLLQLDTATRARLSELLLQNSIDSYLIGAIWQATMMVQQAKVLDPACTQKASEKAAALSRDLAHTVETDTAALDHTRFKIAFLKELSPPADLTQRILSGTGHDLLSSWATHVEAQQKVIDFWTLLVTQSSQKKQEDLKKSLTGFIQKQYKAIPNHTAALDELMGLVRLEQVVHGSWLKKQLLAEEKSNLALARNFYDAKNFAACQKLLNWVLFLDPNSMSAKKLEGFTAYGEGRFEDASKWLAEVHPQDAETTEMYELSTLFAAKGAKKEALLRKLLQSKSTKYDTILLFGLQELLTGHIASASMALSRVRDIYPEAQLGLALIAYQQGNISQAYELVRLQRVFGGQSDAMLALALLCELAMKNPILAQSTVDTLENEKNRPAQEATFHPLILRTLERHFVQLQKSYALARYYELVEDDPETALFWYRKIPVKSIGISLEEAKLEIALEEYQKAKVTLEELLKKTTPLSSETGGAAAEQQVTIQMLLATVLLYQEDILSAYTLIKEAQKAYANYEEVLSAYAFFLQTVHRFDLAAPVFNQLAAYGGSGTLEDQFRKIENDIALIEPKVAASQAQRLSLHRFLSYTSRVRLARIWLQLHNANFARAVLLHPPPRWNSQSLIATMQLYRDIAQFTLATQLWNAHDGIVSRLSHAWMVRASIFNSLSDDKGALNAARIAYEIDPTYGPAIRFLCDHETDTNWLAKELDVLLSTTKTASDEQLPQLFYGTSLLIHLIRDDIVLKGHSKGEFVSLLTHCRERFKKISSQQPDLPLFFFWEARAAIYLQDIAGATSLLQNTIQLDPSYWEASLLLGTVAIAAGKLDEAKTYLRYCLDFHPSSSEAWALLGEIAFREHNWQSAKQHYEQALRFAPHNASLRFAMVRLFEATKNDVLAKFYLESILDLAPTNVEALSMLYALLNKPDFAATYPNKEAFQKERAEIEARLKAAKGAS